MNDQLTREEVTERIPLRRLAPAEFFAVCSSESFFTDPLRLRAVYPAVCDQFARFYGQDPAARYPATRCWLGIPGAGLTGTVSGR